MQSTAASITDRHDWLCDELGDGKDRGQAGQKQHRCLQRASLEWSAEARAGPGAFLPRQPSPTSLLLSHVLSSLTLALHGPSPVSDFQSPAGGYLDKHPDFPQLSCFLPLARSQLSGLHGSARADRSPTRTGLAWNMPLVTRYLSPKLLACVGCLSFATPFSLLGFLSPNVI